ncbi:MAG: DUF411 domain-containing protein [Ahrensia sp.]|nr:DUF411 domain-containing protein [Ahrensia sp.]
MRDIALCDLINCRIVSYANPAPNRDKEIVGSINIDFAEFQAVTGIIAMTVNRRGAIVGILATTLIASTRFSSAKPLPGIHVTQGRGCGCCAAWTKILVRAGFPITEDNLLPADLIMLKTKLGVPTKLVSCHTAMVEGYVIEGHVPPKEIKRLIREKPKILGLAVAGMPYGSPGMGPQNDREAYEVVSFKEDGSQEVFASYEAAAQ